ncbi:hypothetical protein [Tomelloso virus]|uniref:Uncharacterized protein n=1 Tax=Tomelloso virus TaxID=2053981 RepID=A0A2H4T2Z4_9VIRU|nr:hypothetical protein [Tomelloso virus]ATY70259.1 hypothetical protein [Tomelloso virus]
MSSMKGLGTSAINKITPECANIGKSVKVVSLVVLIMVIIATILLVAAIIYNYVKKTANDDAEVQAENEAKKKKVIGGLSITGAVVVFLSALAAIWEYSVLSKAVHRCIPVAN